MSEERESKGGTRVEKEVDQRRKGGSDGSYTNSRMGVRVAGGFGCERV
jgi:hypothetical protein